MKNILRFLSGLLFLPVWYLEDILKRDNSIWLFGSWFGTRYSDNSRAVYEYVLKNNPEIKAWWVTYSEDVFCRLKTEGKPVVMGNTNEGRRLCLKAGLAFVTTSPSEIGGKYLNGAKFIWLWHGVGLKHIMADYRRDMWQTYGLFKKFTVTLNRWLFPYENRIPVDALANTGDFFTQFFCSGFEIGKDKVWVDGYPRNDKLFFSEHENLYEEYKSRFPGARFILYMPTHRTNAMGNKPFNGFESFGFDEQAFYKMLGDGNYVFFNKGHFYDNNASVVIRHERFLNVTDKMYDDLYVLLKDMDILITDFSSVYFDFLLIGKPIILAPFDYELYLSRERSLQFDYNLQKALQVRSWPELLNALNNNDYFVPSSEEQYMFHKYIDGHSCSRIVEKCKTMQNL